MNTPDKTLTCKTALSPKTPHSPDLFSSLDRCFTCWIFIPQQGMKIHLFLSMYSKV